MKKAGASDIVVTPKEVAEDILKHFDRYYGIHGSVLDPFRGDGAFFDAFPKILLDKWNEYDWREIREGRDFFDAKGHYDWIISNPPYSIFTEVLNRSLEIADNIIYLIPLNKLDSSAARVKKICAWGGIPEIRRYHPKTCKFRFGFVVGAVYFKRGYCDNIMQKSYGYGWDFH
jgi:hypothetical protein